MVETVEQGQDIAFFLGAGASVEAGVPDTLAFVSGFEAKLRRAGGRSLLAAFRKLRRTLEAELESRTKEPTKPDIELVLEALGTLANPRTVPAVFLDRLSLEQKFPRRLSVRLLQELRTYIREECLVEAERTGYLDPLRGFLVDAGPLEIFTVNYDIVIEQFLERWGYPYFDGFDLFWSRERTKPGARVILHKLHGSATWFRTSLDRFLRIPTKSPDSGLRLLGSEVAEPLMLYPAQKELYSGPFVDLLVHFKKALERSRWVIVVGYSFRDGSMLRVFREAVASNPNLNLIFIGPSARATYVSTIRRDRVRPLLPPSARAHGSRLRSPLVGRVTVLPFRYGAVLPDLASTIVPAIRESDAAERSAQEAEIRALGPDWRGVVDKMQDALRVDRAREIVESKALLQGADKLWQITFSAKRAMLLAAFGNDPAWRMAWALGEKTLRWHLIESLRIDPGYIGPSTAMISPQFGFEPIFNERGEPQGYRMVNGQQLHDLFLKLTGFLARVRRYAAGCGRDDPLERMARLLSPLEQRTKVYYSQQIRVQDYVAEARLARPRISARLVSELEALAAGPNPSQDTGVRRAQIAEKVRGYEVRRWSALPWLKIAEE